MIKFTYPLIETTCYYGGRESIHASYFLNDFIK